MRNWRAATLNALEISWATCIAWTTALPPNRTDTYIAMAQKP